ncbi:MAG TPA: hypothetical protein VD741_07485 [Solirubrobacterales bacterium]|nr:hypothetical protein [Solirubrobacterales bacterium]
MYAWIGKAVVRHGFRYARRRYGRQVGIGLGLLIAAAGAAVAYFLTREVPEG